METCAYPSEHKRSLRGVLEKFIKTPGPVSPENFRKACERAWADEAAREFRRETEES